MRPPSRRERIAAQLADLKMPGALEALDDVLAGIEGGATTGAAAIEHLLAAQIALRNSRRLEAAMRSSRLPYQPVAKVGRSHTADIKWRYVYGKETVSGTATADVGGDGETASKSGTSLLRAVEPGAGESRV